jgi:Glycosyltransferase Family 4
VRPLKILFTNNTLATRAGSELWVRDVAIALKRRGHEPAAYSPTLGEVAVELRAEGVPVVDDLDALPWRPDLVHGHHHLETMAALARFPGVPGLFVCHGAVPFEEEPPLHPRLLRYVAVDIPCRERIAAAGVPGARTLTIPNFVDLARFPPRAPLPERPARALVFSHNLGEGDGLRAIRKACRAAGIALDTLGAATGRVSATPEEELRRADIVFAKARAALEALATGCAVVLCDAKGLGPLVTAEDFPRLRALNFGYRTLTDPITAPAVSARLAGWDPAGHARASARARAEAGLDAAVDALAGAYAEVLAQPAPDDAEAEGRAFSRHLQGLTVRIKEFDALRRERDILAAELGAARVSLSKWWRPFSGVR